MPAKWQRAFDRLVDCCRQFRVLASFGRAERNTSMKSTSLVAIPEIVDRMQVQYFVASDDVANV